MIIENDKGEEVTVFTAEELEAAKKEVETNYQKTLAEKEAEVEKLRKVSAEKTENFKKFNEMTEAEKAAYDANTTEFLKRTDAAVQKAEELERKLAEKEAIEREYNKNFVLNNFHKGDEKVKKEIEDNYAILAGMPENTPDEIAARATKAAQLAGIVTDPRNPIFTPFQGEAPKIKEEGKEFVDTDKGKEALELAKKALGI